MEVNACFVKGRVIIKMRKSIAFVLCVALLTSLLSGCQRGDEDNLNEISEEASFFLQVEGEVSEESHLEGLLFAIENDIVQYDRDSYSANNELSRISITDETIVLEYGEYSFDGQTNTTYALIGIIAMIDYIHPQGNLFLSLEQDGIYSFHYLGFHNLLSSYLEFADIDGDEFDELVLRFFFLAAIGPRLTDMIIKVEGINAEFLLLTSQSPMAYPQINWFDTGFRFSINDGYQFTVTNILTGYSESFDARGSIDDQLVEYWYDNDGLVDINAMYYGRSFEKDVLVENSIPYGFELFYLIDIDEDGVFEIITARFLMYVFHSSFSIGMEYCLIKYNPQTNTFDVLDADFHLVERGITLSESIDYQVFGVDVHRVWFPLLYD